MFIMNDYKASWCMSLLLTAGFLSRESLIGGYEV